MVKLFEKMIREFHASHIPIYQVCLSIADKGTRKREVSDLEAAMKELQIQSGTIVTLWVNMK
jgi:hypothetical protein